MKPLNPNELARRVLAQVTHDDLRERLTVFLATQQNHPNYGQVVAILEKARLRYERAKHDSGNPDSP